jgi:hypothetical protein
MTFQQLPTTRRGNIGEAIADGYFKSQGWFPYSAPEGSHPIDRLLMTECGVYAIDVKTYPRQFSRACTGIDTPDHHKYLAIEKKGIPVVLLFIDPYEGCIYSGRIAKLSQAAKHYDKKTYYPLQLMKFVRRLTASELESLYFPPDPRYQTTPKYFGINKIGNHAN